METTGAHPSRRAMLALGTGAALAATLTTGGSAVAATPRREDEITRQLKEWERKHSVRIGVYARDTATGRTVEYGAGDAFPMCSVFKTLAAAAVLRQDRHGELLGKRIRYTEQFLKDSGYADSTKKPENLANGMTVAELCAAAVSESDNAAANLLLRELGGPTAITRFCRSIGDDTTRLDRWEPELNSAEPDRETDTTTPGAIGRTYERLVLGHALTRPDRERLTGWLIANTTNKQRFGKGLPGWTLADKTGGGSDYAVANDVGIAWPPHRRAPIVLAVLTTSLSATAPTNNQLVADIAGLVGTALTRG
ncbi:class A beta-lactamase [Streptomyces abikoensis]|uniref:class A beta-lactamase n=1 Tax=Streptomyces abikoensis TaxID=97398 RepID=UPI0037188FA2